jgi:hypothetical protein
MNLVGLLKLKSKEGLWEKPHTGEVCAEKYEVE